MNKAFTKETEDPGNRCPKCSAIGTTVYRETLRAHLPAEAIARLADPAFFCPHPLCEVAYFDSFEQTVPVAGLRQPLYPKDPDAPICPCFGLTHDDIAADVEEGGNRRVKALIERARTEPTSCCTKTADGRSCVPAVQRCFLKLRGG